jgi:hypothetical protein
VIGIKENRAAGVQSIVVAGGTVFIDKSAMVDDGGGFGLAEAQKRLGPACTGWHAQPTIACTF